MKEHQNNFSYHSTNVRFSNLKRHFMQIALTAMGLVFPQTTRQLILKLFFTPLRKKATAPERQWLERAEKFQIRVHGRTVQCWKWGHGPQILVVHGWNGRGVNLHPLFAPLLEKGYAVVAFDAPAHGVSEGDHTNYFEFTDTVRAMVAAMGRKNIVGIIAYSLGGAAVINCLSKENLSVKTALIAPALRLKELLFNTFKIHGVPTRLYQSIISDIETQYGYSIEHDNPFTLLQQMDAKIMIAHDRKDELIPFTDTRVIAGQRSTILLHETTGLGHKNIIQDNRTADAVRTYLTRPAANDGQRQATA